jgi:hypothetical protein
MKINAISAKEYIEAIQGDRKEAYTKLFQVVSENIPEGFTACMQYGFPSFVVSLDDYPTGYHCTPNTPLPFVSVGAQKTFLALYHMGIYSNSDLMEWFVAEYPKHAKYKLDMGKSCIRFKRMNDIPFGLIAELMKRMSVKQWIDIYELNYKK